MFSLLNECMSKDISVSNRAMETLNQMSENDFIHLFVDMKDSEFQSNHRVFAVLLKAHIKKKKKMLLHFFSQFDESNFLDLYTTLAEKVESFFDIEVKSFTAAFLIALLIVSNPARYDALNESMIPQLIFEDEGSFLPRMIVYYSLFKCLSKQRIPVKLQNLCLFSKDSAFKVLSSSNESPFVLSFAIMIIKKISKNWPQQLTIDECNIVFDSLPRVLPNSDIQLYKDVHQLVISLVENCYPLMESLRDKVCNVFLNGLSTEKEFFDITMKYWTSISDFEQSIIQTNNELHEDYQILQRKCLNLSIQMLDAFISTIRQYSTEQLQSLPQFLYVNAVEYCFKIDTEKSFGIIVDFVESLRQNEEISDIAFNFIQCFAKSPTTYQYMASIKESVMAFVSGVYSNPVIACEANSIINNFPELFFSVDDAREILEGLKKNCSDFAGQVLSSLIDCFPKDIHESPLFEIADEILDFTFSYLEADNRYNVIKCFVEHVNKDNEHYLISLLDFLFDSDDIGGLSDVIDALSFNEEQSRELFHKTLELDQELLFSPDGILTLATVIKKAESFSDEEFSSIKEIVHHSLDILDEIGSAIGVLVSRLFIKFDKKVMNLAEDVFNHIIITLKQEHTTGNALLKAAADIIETVGPINGAMNDFAQAIWSSFSSLDEGIASSVRYIGYSIMILISTYFDENTEEQSTYIEMIIKYLISSQSEFNEYDDMKQICNTCNVIARHITTKQARQILKGSNCAVLKEGIKYKSTHDICKEALDALKAV